MLRQGTWSMQDEKVKVICWMLRMHTYNLKKWKWRLPRWNKWKQKLTSWKNDRENSQSEKVKVKLTSWKSESLNSQAKKWNWKLTRWKIKSKSENSQVPVMFVCWHPRPDMMRDWSHSVFWSNWVELNIPIWPEKSRWKLFSLKNQIMTLEQNRND